MSLRDRRRSRTDTRGPLSTYQGVHGHPTNKNRRYNSPCGHCCQLHFRGSEILQFSGCSLLCSTSTIELPEALRMV